MNKKYFTLVFLFFLILFLTGMMETIIVGIMPAITEQFHTVNSITGQLITVYSIIFAVVGPLLIFLVRKLNLKKSILTFLVIFSFSNFLTFWSFNLPILFISRIICAVSASVLVAKTLESCFLIFKEDKKKLALVNMGFSSSIALGVPLGTYISSLVDWENIFLGIGIISLVLFIILIFIYPETESNFKQNFKIKLSDLVTGNNLRLLLTTMLILTANMAFIGYISPYFIEGYSFNTSTISWLLAILGIGGVCGSYVSAWLMEKFRARSSLAILLVLFIIFLIVISFRPPLYLLAFLLFFWNLCQWATGPIIQFEISNKADEHSREQIISLNMSALNAGSALGGLIGGIYISYFSIHSIPLLAAFVALIAFLVIMTGGKK